MLSYEKLLNKCSKGCQNCNACNMDHILYKDILRVYESASAKFCKHMVRFPDENCVYTYINNNEVYYYYEIFSIIEYFNLRVEDACKKIYDELDFDDLSKEEKKTYHNRIYKMRSAISKKISNIEDQDVGNNISAYIKAIKGNVPGLSLNEKEIKIFKALITVWNENKFDALYRIYLGTKKKTKDMMIGSLVMNESNVEPSLVYLCLKYTENCFTNDDINEITENNNKCSKDRFLEILAKSKIF